jgi:hypothetical protein
MLWFITHNILKKYTPMEHKKRNLITFFSGILLYIVFYSYVVSFDCINHQRLFGYFFCIIMSDVLAISAYKKTIFPEVKPFLKETMEPKMPAKVVETNTCDSKEEVTSESIPLLKNDSDYIDENEGFVKETALGNAYTTNGKSNA